MIQFDDSSEVDDSVEVDNSTQFNSTTQLNPIRPPRRKASGTRHEYSSPSFSKSSGHSGRGTSSI